MLDGLDIVYRPMLSTPPLCTYKELTDGTYSLEDVYNMNDALDVRDENNARVMASRES